MSEWKPKKDEICKCCCGTGVQINKDGIKIRCPACDGTGYWKKEQEHINIFWKPDKFGKLDKEFNKNLIKYECKM